jgi:hypothetical protein
MRKNCFRTDFGQKRTDFTGLNQAARPANRSGGQLVTHCGDFLPAANGVSQAQDIRREHLIFGGRRWPEVAFGGLCWEGLPGKTEKW